MLLLSNEIFIVLLFIWFYKRGDADSLTDLNIINLIEGIIILLRAALKNLPCGYDLLLTLRVSVGCCVVKTFAIASQLSIGTILASNIFILNYMERDWENGREKMRHNRVEDKVMHKRSNQVNCIWGENVGDNLLSIEWTEHIQHPPVCYLKLDLKDAAASHPLSLAASLSSSHDMIKCKRINP